MKWTFSFFSQQAKHLRPVVRRFILFSWEAKIIQGRHCLNSRVLLLVNICIQHFVDIRRRYGVVSRPINVFLPEMRQEPRYSRRRSTEIASLVNLRLFPAAKIRVIVLNKKMALYRFSGNIYQYVGPFALRFLRFTGNFLTSPTPGIVTSSHKISKITTHSLKLVFLLLNCLFAARDSD